MAFSREYYNPPKGSAESKAISELLGLKVSQLMTDDPASYEITGTFEDVWYACAHEADMYEEYALSPGCSQEDYDDYFGGTGGLNIRSYRGAVRWLSKYEALSTLNSSEEYCKANGLPFRRQYGQR